MYRAIFIFSAILLSACASYEKPSYVGEYKSLISISNSQAPPADAIENFVNLFSDLNAPDLAEKVKSVYAQDMYFNDTIQTINQRSDMLEYLKHTAKNLDSYKFTLTDHAVSGENLYLRWTMDIEFTALGKEIKSQSVGMTHLKFNTDGQVVVHQDYWDSVEALYQHIPYIGYWVKKARSQL